MERLPRETETLRQTPAGTFSTPVPGASMPSSPGGVARAAWAWASVAVCAATIPFLPGLAGSRTFYVRDLAMFFWGRYLWLRHELLSGSFPLWDPYVGGGQSAVADALHQLFLLPALAVRLIGTDVVGFNLWVATPFPLAALGAWLFFRRRFAADASALGAIAFALSGPIVSTGNFPNLSWSAAAIPWVLWAIDRAGTVATPRHIAALAVMTSLQAFSGEPVTLLATLVVGLAFAAIVSPPPGPTFALRARLAASVVAGLGLGLGVAAVQLVPLGRAAALSERSSPIAKDFWSLHPLALVETVSVHLFGDFFASQSLASTPWLPVLHSGREPFLFSIYFGVPLLCVALFGLVAGARRWTLFWAGAGAASLLCAFGAHTPVYPFLRDHLPLLPSLRFPAKYMVVSSMVVAAGAATGWEAMAGKGHGRRVTRARFAAIGLPLTIGAIAWAAAGACMYAPAATASRLFGFANVVHVADPVEAAVFMLQALPRAASMLLVLSAVTAVLVFSGTRVHHRASAAARMTLFGLIVVDLAASAWGVNPTINPAYLAEPAWLSSTHAHPDSRFYVGGKTGGTLEASDLDSSALFLNPRGLKGAASRAALSAQANFYPSGWRSREMISYDLAILWPRDFATMTRRFVLSGRLERDLFLDRTGVRYRVLPRRESGGRTPIAPVPYLMESFLFDYGAGVAPRVMVVAQAEVIGDTAQQIERLFESGWDIRSTALIGREPAPAGDAGPPVPSSATITTDTANRVVVEAGIGAAGGYLVMLDSFSDDWRATADGHTATVVRANGLFRAIRLTPGVHLVDFRYRPRAFFAGAAASAAALTLVLGLLLKRRPV